MVCIETKGAMECEKPTAGAEGETVGVFKIIRRVFKVSEKETLNPFVNAQKQVKKACDKLNADPAVYEILKNPMRVIEVNFPVKMDDGTVKTFTGYRAQHNNACLLYTSA